MIGLCVFFRENRRICPKNCPEIVKFVGLIRCFFAYLYRVSATSLVIMLLGKRRREDTGVRPVHERAEYSGEGYEPEAADHLARLYQRVPRDQLLSVLEDSDLESAAKMLGNLELHAQKLVEHYDNDYQCVSHALEQYHNSKKTVNREADTLLRDNLVLKRVVRSLCERLQMHKEAGEEQERLVEALEKERLIRTKMLIRLGQL